MDYHMSSDSLAKRVVPGTGAGLPNPYSKDFDRSEDSISATVADYESAEHHRIKYGKFACKSMVLLTRRAVGLLMAITALAGVVAPNLSLIHI